MFKISRACLILAITVSFAATTHAQAQAQAEQAPPAAEALTAVQAKHLEKSAKTAEDHQRLAAYYQTQLQQAQKNLADAQQLEKKWGPAERASKVPDPYPHARRMVRDYSAQVAKYTKLTVSHRKSAQAILARNAAGGAAGQSKQETIRQQQDQDSATLGPAK